ESGPFETLIIRLDANGTFDDSFGVGGIVRSNFGDFSSYATGVVVAPDGKVLAGVSRCDSNGTCPGVLARFLDDGALDPSFGTGGFAPAIPNASIYDLYVAHDGTITVGGYGNLLGQRHLDVVARMTADGALDHTFGSDGLAAFKGGDEPIGGMVVLDDGSVVAVGSQGEDGAQQNVVVARLEPSGAFDQTFGDGGIVVTDLGATTHGRAVVVRQDGTIVIAGGGTIPGAQKYDSDFVLLAYDRTGHLDPAFGTAGGGSPGLARPGGGGARLVCC